MTPGHAFIRHICMQAARTRPGTRDRRAPSPSMPGASSDIAADRDAHTEDPRRPSLLSRDGRLSSDGC